jgi:ubiquinone/menaquinone biosynthesis C-methylase UbiE
MSRERGRDSTPTWSTGRYPSLASNLLPATARIVRAAGITPEDLVLDVGCGTGNAALTARHHDARVVGVDLTPGMLELARENATLAGYDDLRWIAGDAESLPFRDAAFDAVLSNFGHVFAPRVEVAAAELLRVTRPGGRIAFSAWSSDGLVGTLTDVVTDHVDFPEHDPWAHLRWGQAEFVRERLSNRCKLDFERRVARFRYVSPRHFWREFAEESGPLSPVLRRIEDPDERETLRREALDALEEWFADNAVRVEYLLVSGTTRPA